MTIFIVLVVISALLLEGVFIYVVSRDVLIGWASLLFTEWVNFTFGTSASVVGSLHISPPDIVNITLLVAGAIRTIPRLRTPSTARLYATGYLVVFAFSFLRGVAAAGFFSASNESRSYVGLLAAMLYFLTAPVDDESVRKYISAYIIYGAALFTTAALAAAGLHVGSVAWAHDQDAAGINGRYLPSAAAAGLAVAFILALGRNVRRPLGVISPVLPALLFGMSILLRHRTIWMMLLVSLASLTLLDRRTIRKFLPALVVLGIIAGSAQAFLSSGDKAEQENQLTDAATNSGTLVWRVNAWTEVVTDSEQNLLTIFLGKPVGTGWWRFEPSSGRYVNLPPHSEYVTVFARVGVVGLFFLLLFVTRPIRILWRWSRGNRFAVEPTTSAWCVACIALGTYGFTYGLEGSMYPILALANLIASRLLQEHPSVGLLQKRVPKLSASRLTPVEPGAVPGMTF